MFCHRLLLESPTDSVAFKRDVRSVLHLTFALGRVAVLGQVWQEGNKAVSKVLGRLPGQLRWQVVHLRGALSFFGALGLAG